MEVVGYETRTARKKHRCDLCGGDILPGEQYERWCSVNMGSVLESKVHKDCRHVINSYCLDVQEHEWQDDWIMEWVTDCLEPNISCKGLSWPERIKLWLEHYASGT